MTGTIRCTKCDGVFTSQGICSKCGTIRAYVHIYSDGRQVKLRKTKDGAAMGYMQALDMLVAINRELRENSGFNPLDWSHSKVKGRRLEVAIHAWLDQKKAEAAGGELAPGTIKDYRGYVDHYFIPLLGKLDIREIGYEHLDDFRNKLPGRLKLKTRRNIINALHTAFVWLWKRGDIVKLPPFPAIEGYDATPRRAHTREEQAKGLKLIPEVHRDVIEFGMETGLRAGELCALKICDVMAASRKMRVQRLVYDGQERETTKGRRKDEVVLSDRAWEIVQGHVRGRELMDYLFMNAETGRKYPPKKLNETWRKHSGFDTCFHEAGRHSFCSQLGEIEENALILQDLMRHADIRTTKGYCHPRDEKIRDIVNRRGDVIPFPIRKVEKSD